MKCTAERCVRGFIKSGGSDYWFFRCDTCHGTGEVPDKPKEPEINLPDGFELWKAKPNNHTYTFYRTDPMFDVPFINAIEDTRFSGFVFWSEKTQHWLWEKTGKRIMWINKHGCLKSEQDKDDGFTVAPIYGAVLRKEGKE